MDASIKGVWEVRQVGVDVKECSGELSSGGESVNIETESRFIVDNGWDL